MHAGIRRARDGAHDDVIESEAKGLLLLAHLFGEADIAEPAIFVHRGTGRDDVGLPDDALLFDLLTVWAPDAATRKRILVDNPVALYDFARSA